MKTILFTVTFFATFFVGVGLKSISPTLFPIPDKDFQFNLTLSDPDNNYIAENGDLIPVSCGNNYQTVINGNNEFMYQCKDGVFVPVKDFPQTCDKNGGLSSMFYKDKIIFECVAPTEWRVWGYGQSATEIDFARILAKFPAQCQTGSMFSPYIKDKSISLYYNMETKNYYCLENSKNK